MCAGIIMAWVHHKQYAHVKFICIIHRIETQQNNAVYHRPFGRIQLNVYMYIHMGFFETLLRQNTLYGVKGGARLWKYLRIF